MKTEFINTAAIYHEIIAAPLEEATAIYLEKLVKPWQQMMNMMGGDNSDDPLAGAKIWHWMLPEQLTSVPEVLQKLEAADAWKIGAEAMQKAVARFEPYNIPFESFTGWLYIAGDSDPIMRGYTGAIHWFEPHFVLQYDTMTEANLRALPGAAVHEMNHLIRLKYFPWGMDTTVADYIIHEGVAESFAGSLFGDEVLGYYVTEFDDNELETAKRVIGEGLQKSGFDIIRSYIFGDHWAETLNLPKFGVPPYGGYAIGYRVVQAYLHKTGKSIEEATLTPAMEIIEQSEFFA